MKKKCKKRENKYVKQLYKKNKGLNFTIIKNIEINMDIKKYMMKFSMIIHLYQRYFSLLLKDKKSKMEKDH